MILINPTNEQVIKHLSHNQFNLILVGDKSQLQITSLINQCNEKEISIAGGIFPGIISDTNNSDSGVIIKKYEASTKTEIFQDLQNTSEFRFPVLNSEHQSALIFIDGLSTKISYFLEKTYSHFWDHIKFIGGGCGSLSLIQQPCVFNNEGFYEDAALMVFLKQTLNVGVQHGWKKISGPFVVSASEGNVIHELNWRPAFAVYKETIENHGAESITTDNFFNVAKAFPFGVYKEGMEDIVRDPIFTDGNSLTCVGEVHNNSVVNILNGKTIDLIDGAEIAAKEALSTDMTTDVLLVDCISRSLFHEKEFTRELNKILKVINHQKLSIPLEGILSLGEISSYGDGYLEFFNKTIVVGAFQNHDR